MADMTLVRRNTGVLTGTSLALLGAWGALIPLLGPYFHYAYTPDQAWQITSGRFWMELLPGVCAFLGGLLVLISRVRAVELFGACVAAASGAWFALGQVLAPLRPGGWSAVGAPVGVTTRQVAEQIGFFAGLGVVIVLLAGIALGRLGRVPARLVSAETGAETGAEPAAGPAAGPAAAVAAAAVPASAGAGASAPSPALGPFASLIRSRRRSGGANAA